jgi:hypothetical protein
VYAVLGGGHPRTYSHNNLSFLFLLVYYEFGSKKSKKCKHISCEHPHIISEFFNACKFKFERKVSWYHIGYGVTRYFPRVTPTAMWFASIMQPCSMSYV